MSKERKHFECAECGQEVPRWMGQCPSCEAWNTLVEIRPRRASEAASPAEVLPLDSIEPTAGARTRTGVDELDRVLGGGLVPGSVVLIAGPPGIGKSTLMLELCRALSDRKVLLVSGEESTGQVRLRADRMQLGGASILVLAETRAEIIADTLRTGSFAAAVVDSVQTLYLSGVSGAPGSVSQVRECAQLLQEHAKSTGTPLLLIGHVTKDGSVAGPRVLEHLVDAVLYMEGDRHHSYRLLRAVKNRFGATNEIGVFELWAGGLRPVANPSGLFLPEHSSSQSGSAVACALEGTRPFLVEVQALASETAYPSPQRVSNGVDAKRLQMLVAIIERRTGASLRGHDVFVNVAGGIRLSEPASDAAIAVSILSSVRDVPVRDATMILGEVGLSGEVRPVSHLDTRLKEAERLGFARALLPAGSSGKGVRSGTIELIEAATLSELVERVLS